MGVGYVQEKSKAFIIGILLVSGITGCNKYQKGNMNSGSEAVLTEENSEKMEADEEMIEKTRKFSWKN